MMNLADLKSELIGEEMSFTELDNFMMKNGFYSVFDDGITSEVKEYFNVVYTSKSTNEAEVKIDFEITIDSGEDEAEENFYLLVKEVDTI